MPCIAREFFNRVYLLTIHERTFSGMLIAQKKFTDLEQEKQEKGSGLDGLQTRQGRSYLHSCDLGNSLSIIDRQSKGEDLL